MTWVWDIYPLVSPREGDRVFRPVQVFGVSNGVIAGGDKYNLPSGELLLPLCLDRSPSIKDQGNSLGGS